MDLTLTRGSRGKHPKQSEVQLWESMLGRGSDNIIRFTTVPSERVCHCQYRQSGCYKGRKVHTDFLLHSCEIVTKSLVKLSIRNQLELRWGTWSQKITKRWLTGEGRRSDTFYWPGISIAAVKNCLKKGIKSKTRVGWSELFKREALWATGSDR